jgi:hypothetical protein
MQAFRKDVQTAFARKNRLAQEKNKIQEKT